MHHAAPGPNPLQLQAISRYAACRNAAICDERKNNGVQEALSSNLNTRTIMWRQNRCLLRKARLYRAFLLPKRRFPFVDRLELPKSKYQIHRQIESKNLSAFFITLKRRNQICCRKNEPNGSRLGTTPRWTATDGWKCPRTASPSAGSTVC